VCFVPVQVLPPCGAPVRAHSSSPLSLTAYQLERSSSDRAASRPGPPAFITTTWCRNLHRLSIAYACRPRLRPDSPTAEWPCSGTLGHSAVGVRTPHVVTHPDIRTRPRSAPAYADASLRSRRSPTTGSLSCQSHASVWCFAPVHCRRRAPRPVSYYALFQGWLLLSQPPGCLGSATSFTTQHQLGDLSGGSGLLPS
jgi:hypothetical protein